MTTADDTRAVVDACGALYVIAGVAATLRDRANKATSAVPTTVDLSARVDANAVHTNQTKVATRAWSAWRTEATYCKAVQIRDDVAGVTYAGRRVVRSMAANAVAATADLIAQIHTIVIGVADQPRVALAADVAVQPFFAERLGLEVEAGWERQKQDEFYQLAHARAPGCRGARLIRDPNRLWLADIREFETRSGLG